MSNVMGSIGGQTPQSMLGHGAMSVAASGGQGNLSNPLGGNNLSAAGVASSGMVNMPGTSSSGGGGGSGAQHGNQQMPNAADISLMLSLSLGLNPSEAQQLANWDLQKLAMYLVSNLFRIHQFQCNTFGTSKFAYQTNNNQPKFLQHRHIRNYF